MFKFPLPTSSHGVVNKKIIIIIRHKKGTNLSTLHMTLVLIFFNATGSLVGEFIKNMKAHLEPTSKKLYIYSAVSIFLIPIWMVFLSMLSHHWREISCPLPPTDCSQKASRLFYPSMEYFEILTDHYGWSNKELEEFSTSFTIWRRNFDQEISCCLLEVSFLKYHYHDKIYVED